jgi:hypothetical protein
MSWLTSRMARIGFSSVRSRMTTPASIMRSTRSVAPTLSSVVVSGHVRVADDDVQAAVALASACGSSRVLMIGRLRVVALETPSQMCSARWLTQ